MCSLKGIFLGWLRAIWAFFFVARVPIPTDHLYESMDSLRKYSISAARFYLENADEYNVDICHENLLDVVISMVNHNGPFPNPSQTHLVLDTERRLAKMYRTLSPRGKDLYRSVFGEEGDLTEFVDLNIGSEHQSQNLENSDDGISEDVTIDLEEADLNSISERNAIDTTAVVDLSPEPEELNEADGNEDEVCVCMSSEEDQGVAEDNKDNLEPDHEE